MPDSLPNPVTSPPWWQLLRWIADPLGSLEDYQRTYGDTFTADLASLGRVVIFSEPQAVQEIFNQSSKFYSGIGNSIAEPLVGRNSITLMDGDRHRRERKLLMPPFHGERLQTYAAQICTISRQVASGWQVGERFVARAAMQSISLEVILQVVFGLSTGERYEQIKTLLVEWLDMTDSPLRSSLLFFKFLQQDWGPWSPWGRVKARQRQIHALLQAEIDERRARDRREEDTDILSLMLLARHEDGQPMTDDELRDELLSLLFAGHETTAVILAWAFHQLYRNPAARRKLLQELADLGTDASPAEIARLPYLTAVSQEVLRMYPVIPILFPRIPQEEVCIGGRIYPPQTILAIAPSLLHYREDLYPQSQEFRPERFLERQYGPAEYVPFGGGDRRCLGYALAQMEIKLVLATILADCELSLAEPQPVRAQRRGLVLGPAGGVRMVKVGARERVPAGV